VAVVQELETEKFISVLFHYWLDTYFMLFYVQITLKMRSPVHFSVAILYKNLLELKF
jgi:hypothetical protein